MSYKLTPTIPMSTDIVREQRIELIAQHMRDMTWQPRVQIRKLAGEWNLMLDQVRNLARQAAARVVSEIGDPARVMLTIASALERVVHEALEDGDRSSVINACKVWAQLTGVNAPTRVEVSNPLEKLSDEELEQRYLAALERAKRVMGHEGSDSN